MRLDLSGGRVTVTLSERNVLALLQKVDDPSSARTLTSGNAYRDGFEIADVLLVVRVEPDEEHYVEREPPGPMHPRAEAFIAASRRCDWSRN